LTDYGSPARGESPPFSSLARARPVATPSRYIALSHGTIPREVARRNENTRLEFLARAPPTRILKQNSARAQAHSALRAQPSLLHIRDPARK